MVKVKFEYCDDYSNGEWREQECVVNSVEECKKLYGLGIDCEYRIISVEKKKKKKRREYLLFSFNSSR